MLEALLTIVHTTATYGIVGVAGGSLIRNRVRALDVAARLYPTFRPDENERFEDHRRKYDGAGTGYGSHGRQVGTRVTELDRLERECFDLREELAEAQRYDESERAKPLEPDEAPENSYPLLTLALTAHNADEEELERTLEPHFEELMGELERLERVATVPYHDIGEADLPCANSSDYGSGSLGSLERSLSAAVTQRNALRREVRGIVTAADGTIEYACDGGDFRLDALAMKRYTWCVNAVDAITVMGSVAVAAGAYAFLRSNAPDVHQAMMDPGTTGLLGALGCATISAILHTTSNGRPGENLFFGTLGAVKGLLGYTGLYGLSALFS